MVDQPTPDDLWYLVKTIIPSALSTNAPSESVFTLLHPRWHSL